MRVLLECGADPDAQQSGGTPLFITATTDGWCCGFSNTDACAAAALICLIGIAAAQEQPIDWSGVSESLTDRLLTA